MTEKFTWYSPRGDSSRIEIEMSIAYGKSDEEELPPYTTHGRSIFMEQLGEMKDKALDSISEYLESITISGVNDNVITPGGVVAGVAENTYKKTKHRWSERFSNHGKYWDRARLVGNGLFVVGSAITAANAVTDIAQMNMRGAPKEDMALKGVDAALDIAMGRVAMAGPIGLGVAAAYYAADYLAGGNLAEFVYRTFAGRREEEQ